METTIHHHGRKSRTATFLGIDGTTANIRPIGRDLSETVGPLTDGQQGMIDTVWTGDRLGVVWIHDDPATGSHVWFFELDTDGNILLEPRLLKPEATQSFNPAITWIETDAMRYYYTP